MDLWNGRKLLFFFVSCVLAAVLLLQMQNVSITRGMITSLNGIKYIQTNQTNGETENWTSPELAELLWDRLRSPVDVKKVILNRSCDEINTLSGCVDKTCKQSISLDPDQRLRDIFTSSKLNLTSSQRKLIQSIARSIPETDVIIVSATSSNHFNEMQAMFQNLHQVIYPRLTNFSMVLFDIGLNDKELLLSTIAKARKYLVWQDSSVRWAENFPVIFKRTEQYGHQMLRYIDSNRVPAHTLRQTFDYMQDDPCVYMPYPEIQGNCMLHKNDPLVIRAVLEPWAKCALEKECICPADPGSVLACNPQLKIHRCHRFDQSALTIILAKIYGEEMYRFISPETSFENPHYIFVRRGHSVADYFIS